jgi:hypothetical protein
MKEKDILVPKVVGETIENSLRRILEKKASLISSKFLPILPPIFDIIKEITETQREIERQKTARAAIEAKRSILEKFIGFIDSNLGKILEEKREERGKTLEILLSQIEKVVEKENEEALIALLKTLEEIMKSPIVTKEEMETLVNGAFKKLNSPEDDDFNDSISRRKITW